MKIVFEIERLSTNGGIERVLTNRANYMADVWGWDVTILVLLYGGEEPYFALSEKVKVECLNVKTKGIRMCIDALWRLNKAVKRLQPDIYVTFQTIGAMSCLLNTHRRKTIYESHSARKYMLHPVALTMAERFADAVVVLTKSQEKEFLKAKRIATIPNFTLIKPKGTPDYASKTVVAAGRKCYEKNFERLEMLWGRIEKALQQENKEDASRQKENTSWQLKIHHNTKDMAAAYMEGSIFAMTSRTEGFSMVLIEAMSCGLPCVVFDCEYGPRDIIEDGKTGYLIPYSDDDRFVERMLYLIKNIEIREQMGKNAQQAVKRFSQENIMKQWRELYESLVVK